jgi:preprotein translocase subunit Sec63
MASASVNDSYRILGISQGVSPDEIKNAYRTTVVIYQSTRERIHRSLGFEMASGSTSQQI